MDKKENINYSEVHYEYQGKVYCKYKQGDVSGIASITTDINNYEVPLNDTDKSKMVQKFMDKELNETIEKYCIDRELNVGVSGLQTVNGRLIGYYIDKEDYSDSIYCLYQNRDLKGKKQFYEYKIPCSSYARLTWSECLTDNPKDIEYAKDFMKIEDFIKLQNII